MESQNTTLSEHVSPAFIGKRIENHSFESSMKMSSQKLDKETEAGMVLLASSKNYIKYYLKSDKIILSETLNGKTTELASVDFKSKKYTYFKVSAEDQKMSFQISNDGKTWVSINKDFLPRSLFKYTFTGSFVGVYTTSTKFDTHDIVKVDWFDFKNL